ncbi:MAG: MgtC/SapB family protein [Candidatus Doudnabacteria bacterium]|nr:MgtC/SapB family protein [Candidatus Doudnabacteria bacterium]
MQDLEILARLLLAIGFGAILGLETETRTSSIAKQTNQTPEALQNLKLGGVRTYTLLSLFGALGGLLFYSGQAAFGYLIFGAVIGLILLAYFLNVYYRRSFGITTEIAIMIVTIVGFLATSGLISLQILVVIVVILTFVLSQKEGIAYFVNKIAHEELIDVVKFTIVALVILPFLPNKEVYLGELDFVRALISSGNLTASVGEISLINPFRLWQYVVLISGFSLLGYFASKALGQRRGLLLTGVVGGFVSSTSVIVSFAAKSREVVGELLARSLAGGALLAHAISFLQVSVISLSVSLVFFNQIIPLAVTMAGVSLFIGALLVFAASGSDEDFTLTHKPFSLSLALKFAVFLTVVKLVVQLANLYLPDTAFILVTALSGFAGIDVAAIALGEIVSRGDISLTVTLTTFAAVNYVNFAAKSFYAYWQGTKDYAKSIILGMLLSAIATGVVLVVLVG